jgi:hypothetical protein
MTKSILGRSHLLSGGQPELTSLCDPVMATTIHGVNRKRSPGQRSCRILVIDDELPNRAFVIPLIKGGRRAASENVQCPKEER